MPPPEREGEVPEPLEGDGLTAGDLSLLGDGLGATVRGVVREGVLGETCLLGEFESREAGWVAGVWLFREGLVELEGRAEG